MGTPQGAHQADWIRQPQTQTPEEIPEDKPQAAGSDWERLGAGDNMVTCWDPLLVAILCPKIFPIPDSKHVPFVPMIRIPFLNSVLPCTAIVSSSVPTAVIKCQSADQLSSCRPRAVNIAD